MTFCGFDEQMLSGIDALYEGMARAVMREGPTYVQRNLEKELLDMDAFIESAQALPPGRREQLTGLWQFGRAFYQNTLERIAAGTPAKEAFSTESSTTLEMLTDIDKQFYTALAEKREAMPELIAWVNKNYTSR